MLRPFVAAALVAVMVFTGGRAWGSAVCNDGSLSTATGSGACSGHGGVNTWIIHKPTKAESTHPVTVPVTQPAVTAPVSVPATVAAPQPTATLGAATTTITGASNRTMNLWVAVGLLGLVVAIESGVILYIRRRHPPTVLSSIKDRIA